MTLAIPGSHDTFRECLPWRPLTAFDGNYQRGVSVPRRPSAPYEISPDKLSTPPAQEAVDHRVPETPQESDTTCIGLEIRLRLDRFARPKVTPRYRNSGSTRP